MAGIAGGVDWIDLSVRPMASGTVQPDVRSMAHALKGTGYSLDVDPAKMAEIEAPARRGAEGLRVQPDHDHRGCPGGGFPDAGRGDRPQRAHDGRPRASWTSTATCSRSSRWWWKRRGLDQRDPGKPAVLAAGLQQRAPRPLEEDRPRLRPLGARLLRPSPAGSRSGSGQDCRRAARDASLRRRSAGGRAGFTDRGQVRPRGAEAGHHRREHLPGGLGHRAGQEHGVERGDPAALRQGQDHAAAEAQGSAGGTRRRRPPPATGAPALLDRAGIDAPAR